MFDSPDTISFPTKNVGLVDLKVPTDNLVVQDSNITLVKNKALKLGGEEKGEVTQKNI